MEMALLNFNQEADKYKARIKVIHGYLSWTRVFIWKDYFLITSSKIIRLLKFLLEPLRTIQHLQYSG